MQHADEILIMLAVLILTFCLVYISMRHKPQVPVANQEHSAGVISQELLEILVCPLCKKTLALKNEVQSLKCSECRRVYPIRNGIPILLIDEATIEES